LMQSSLITLINLYENVYKGYITVCVVSKKTGHESLNLIASPSPSYFAGPRYARSLRFRLNDND
jgi:hypothetical protein